MTTGGLVASARRLETDPDLVALCGDDGVLVATGGVGIVGTGTAATISVPDRGGVESAAIVAEALGAIDVDGLPDDAPLPVALGALPFDPSASADLVVPRLAVVRRADGSAWLLAVHERGDDPTADEIDAWLSRIDVLGRGFNRDAGLHPSSDAPSHFDVRPLRAPTEWCSAVAEVTERIRAGLASKVVLARGIEVHTDRPVRAGAVLSHLRRAFPGSHLFSIDGFVGASPELLVERDGGVVRAHPMAGTAPRSGDAETDARLAEALLASTNTRDEHRQTIDMVHDTLLPWCSYLDEEAHPAIVAVANVQHLATRLEGRLSDPSTSVLELVAALHPTPAVGGVPRDGALATIAELEHLDRGRYAGPVGWVDAAGNGRWVVGIRSATLHDGGAILYAGVGVVADSDPEAELAETRAKLQTMLGAIVRP